jgi:hypothetical protein
MAATNKCLAHFNKSGMQAKATKKCVADITATDLARPNGPPPHHALAAAKKGQYDTMVFVEGEIVKGDHTATAAARP